MKRLKGLLLSRLPVLLLLALALFLKLDEPRALQNLRLNVFDYYQRIFPREYQEVGVRIIDVDDETLNRYGQWPWPRARVAELVDKLTQYGVAAIGFDMVFAEPDRLSPERLADDFAGLVDSEALKTVQQVMPDSDRILADALSRAPAVMGFVLTGTETPQRPLQRWGIGQSGDDPLLFLRRFAGAITDLPLLEKAARGNGSFNAIPDDDGTIRRVFLLFQLDGSIIPSLSMELLRVVQGASTYLVKASGASGSESFGSQTGITAVKVGAIEVLTDWESAVWLHFTGPRPERFVPAWQVLDGVADPALLGGHIVLIGTSAAGLKDQRASPLDPAGPGVEIHAQALEQILLGIRLVRPDWAVGAEFVYLLFLGGLLVWLLPRLSPGICLAVGVVAVVLAFGGSLLAFLKEGLLFDPLLPATSVLLLYIAGSFTGYLKTEGERARVRSAFSYYLAPAMVERLARSSDSVRLGGDQRDLTVMFSDIRSFSRLSQLLDPTELTRMLNRFFTPMTEIIQEREGTIDKYIGDCIMAFWNAPLDDPNHARNACRAALGMLAGTRELDKKLREEKAYGEGKDFHLRIGIGLNTGSCLVGNMGSDRRFNYTALGFAVNESQRIEAQCKTYGVELLVSAETAEGAKDFAFLKVDRVILPGSEKSIEMHALVGDQTVAETPAFQQWKATHDAMHEAYLQRDFSTAAEQARAAQGLADERHKALYERYLTRFPALAESGTPPDWDGTVLLKDK